MSKNLTKKEKKAFKNREGLIYELSLLISGFSYLTYQYQKVSEDEKDNGVAKNTRSLLKALSIIINHHVELRQEAISNYSTVTKDVDTSNINILLTALSLIGEQVELKNKMINLFATDNMNDLIDYTTGKLSNDTINRSFKVAKLIQKKLSNLKNKRIKEFSNN